MVCMDNLIADIYEAAAMPHEWQRVLTEIAKFAGCKTGLIFTGNNKGTAYECTENFAEIFKEYIENDWFSKTDRTNRLIRQKHSGFVTDFDVFSRIEFQNEPLFNSFFHKKGIHSGVATSVELPSSTNIVFDFENGIESGPVTPEAVAKLDLLRPHLCRAALLSARLELKTVQTTVDALDRVAIPAIAVGDAGQPLAVNSACEALIGVIVRADRKISLTHRPADLLLQNALVSLSREYNSTTRSIAIPASDQTSAFVAHVIPMRRSARDIFTAASALLIFSEFSGREPLSIELVMSLFDLTHTEARVARSVASGKTVEEIARAFGTQEATVRSQLKKVMQKTGTGRQLDLTRLIT